MIAEIKVNEEYYFFNIHLPTGYPHKVIPTSIAGNVVVFDTYIVNEKFADIRVIKESLFNTYICAERALAGVVSQNGMHFVEPSLVQELQEKYPEMGL